MHGHDESFCQCYLLNGGRAATGVNSNLVNFVMEE